MQLTICILDDDKSLSEALKLTLSLAGHEVRIFSDPAQFIDESVAHEGALVLIVDHDLGLPSTNGYDVIRDVRLRRNDGLHVPAIYLTGRENEHGFLKRSLVNPHEMPSTYVAKSSLVDFDLGALASSLYIQSCSALDIADRQAVRRASRFLSEIEHETLDD